MRKNECTVGKKMSRIKDRNKRFRVKKYDINRKYRNQR